MSTSAAERSTSRETDESLLGAFARIYQRDDVDQLANAFAQDRLTQVQLNLSALGVPTIPDAEQLSRLSPRKIRSAFTSRGRVIWGVSATYNTAHPDPTVRQAQTTSAAYFIASLAELGPVAATLCTGTRDPDNMWRRHPDNDSPEAWDALRTSLDELIPAARHAGVLLAVEPEPGNVVSGTSAALRLLDDLGDDADQVGVILDPANLVSDARAENRNRILTAAFDQLGERTICVHAKDVQPWADTLAGQPGVDYRLVDRLYAGLPRPVPLIIQDASEAELPHVRDWLLARRA